MVDNPLQMNDWEIKRFLYAVLAIQLVIAGLIIVPITLGFDTPVLLRQVVGFVYLAFIPGVIILRILRLHNLGTVKTLVYSVGLSLAFSMFIGLFTNTLYPYIGIPEPLSTFLLTITITAAVVILCIIAYFRDRGFSNPTRLQVKGILSPPVLFLVLLPILSILGTSLVNYCQSTTLLLLLIAIIALVPVMIAFNRFIPSRLYPLAVITIAIALLYHQSLISTYFIGTGDIHWEYYLSELVRGSSYWDATFPSACNAMLSIMMLPTIYSNLLNIEAVWVFKAIYPLFFSLVPLGLYQVYKEQTERKIAFLSVFFFMSFTTFFTEMVSLTRQQLAELFLILLLLVMLDKKMGMTKRAALAIIFGASLVVSHYGLSYIFILYILVAWIVLKGFTLISSKRGWYANPGSTETTSIKSTNTPLGFSNTIITGTFVGLFIVIALAWYMYIASSSAFYSIVYVGEHIYTGVYTEVFDPAARDPVILLALGLGALEINTLQRQIALVLQYITQFFIVIGVIQLITLIVRRKTKFEPEYITMVFGSTIIILMCILLPYFASSLNMTRLYHISLIFLAPVCVLGGLTVFRGILRPFKFASPHVASSSLHTKLFLLLLIPYFLFNTGFTFQVTGDVPSSIPLSPDTFSHLITHEQDIAAAKWLSTMPGSASVWGDYCAYHLLYYDGFFPKGRANYFRPSFDDEGEIGVDETKIDDEGAIYLSYGNVAQNRIWVFSRSEKERIYKPVALENTEFPLYRNKIYDNGCSIYK